MTPTEQRIEDMLRFNENLTFDEAKDLVLNEVPI